MDYLNDLKIKIKDILGAWSIRNCPLKSQPINYQATLSRNKHHKLHNIIAESLKVWNVPSILNQSIQMFLERVVFNTFKTSPFLTRGFSHLVKCFCSRACSACDNFHFWELYDYLCYQFDDMYSYFLSLPQISYFDNIQSILHNEIMKSQ